MSLLGSKQTSVFWKAQATGHPQDKMLAVMMLMLTCVVELWQSLLEAVVNQVCLSVLVIAACPGFLSVSLSYLVRLEPLLDHVHR